MAALSPENFGAGKKQVLSEEYDEELAFEESDGNFLEASSRRSLLALTPPAKTMLFVSG